MLSREKLIHDPNGISAEARASLFMLSESENLKYLEGETFAKLKFFFAYTNISLIHLTINSNARQTNKELFLTKTFI